jgi:hypothetical protein
MITPEYCNQCKRKLNKKNIVWLELDSQTNLYYLPGMGDISPERSQGIFAFGKDCAAAILKRGGELKEWKT